MSYFSYGATPGSTDPTQGIVISYIFSEGMDDVPMMSDDGTELMFVERTIRIRGVLNGGLAPATAGETPSQTLNRIRGTLETPRLQLFYYHNNPILDNTPLCQEPQPGFATDVRYGPIPRHVNLWRIAGSECLMVQLEYVTWVLPCAAGPNPFVSHRWTESANIDEDFRTTRTRTGKITIRADLGTDPNQLKGLVSPSLSPGFKRTRAEYVMQSDGLAMQYTFIDEEQFIQPPLGATKADGEYSETAAQDGKRYGRCRVKLRGPKGVPPGGGGIAAVFATKAQLMATAVQICVQKLGLGGLVTDTSNEGKWLATGGVRESLWENEVEVDLSAIISPSKLTETGGIAADLSRFGSPLFGVDMTTQIPGIDLGPDGSAQLRIIANALNDPCLMTNVLTTGGQSVLKAGGNNTPFVNSLDAVVPAIISTAPTLPNGTTSYDSQDNANGAYGDVTLRARYLSDEQTVVLATAKSGAPAAAVQLGQGTMGVVLEWTAIRYNAPPKVPTTQTADPNLVYVRSEFNPEQIDIAADGVTPIYTISGRYYYSYLDRTQATVNFPVPPYVDAGTAASLTAAPPTMFQSNASQNVTSGGNNVLLTAQPLPSAVAFAAQFEESLLAGGS